MEVELLNFVGYFVGYLLLGFVFFYFVMFRKAGSNLVSTICILLVITSLSIGFMGELHLAIINFFLLILAFWFAYIIIKMNREEKLERERHRNYQEFDYQKRKQTKNLDADSARKAKRW